MLVKLARRNIWRNKRRTFITAASILFAVLFSILMESIQEGAWDHMMDNVINFYYGYGQIQGAGYQDDQSIEKSFVLDSIQPHLQDVPHLIEGVPRLESFALASYEHNTKGVLIIGVDTEKEAAFTKLPERLTDGSYFEAGADQALVGKDLAEYLEVSVSDTLVLISQGYHGVNAAGKYEVAGIMNMGSPALNDRMVYLPLSQAQWFFGAEDRVTSVALHVTDKRHINKVIKQLSQRLDMEEFDVLDWERLIPGLVQAKEFDNIGNYVVYFILYSIIAFGIFGTILMMTKERRYEFGVMVAIGMKRHLLSWSIWLETMLMAGLGALAGMIAAIPVVYYFHINPIEFTGQYAETMEKFEFEPILPAAIRPDIFATQALIVLLITAVLAIYPMIQINRLKPIAAMRS